MEAAKMMPITTSKTINMVLMGAMITQVWVSEHIGRAQRPQVGVEGRELLRRPSGCL
jgi:hypothetical protein